MRSQRANVSVISRCVSGSASLSEPSVSSLKTTPKPNVASGGFRSSTLDVDAPVELAQQDREVEARPARRRRSRRSRERLLEPLELVDVGHRREEDELVAARLLVAAHEVLDRPGARQVSGGDLLGEGPGEGVVVEEVVVAAIGVAEREVALAPELRLSGTAEVAPRSERARRPRSRTPAAARRRARSRPRSAPSARTPGR